MTLETLQVMIRAEIEEYQKSMNQVKAETKSTMSSVQAATSKIKNALRGVMRAVGVGLSVVALVNFGKACVNLGSDLFEVQNVVDVTFGECNQVIEDFAKNAAEQFGLSELAAKKYTSTMGAMLKSMGITGKQLEDMSIQIAGLAGDMASFYNLDSDEAFAKIRAGISGETEPLKQLGINLSVANLEQYALAQGITKSYKAMNQQEQALLRYNYLLSVTADAQGDFERTSDSWANQTRILALRFDSLKASIGQGLINVLTPVIRVLNTIIARLQVAADAFKRFTEVVTGVKSSVSSFTGVNKAVSGAAESADDLTGTTKAAGAAAKKTKEAFNGLGSFDEINSLQKNDSSGGGGGEAGGGLGTEMLTEDLATAEPVIETASGWLYDFFRPFKESWDTLGFYVVDSWRYALEGIKGLTEAVGTSFMEVWTNGTGEQTLKNIYLIIGNIGQIVGGLNTSFTEAWQTAGVGTAIIQNAFDLFNIVLNTIHKITWATADWAKNLNFYPILEAGRGLLESLEPVFQKIGDALSWVWTEVLLPMGSWLIEGAIPAGIDLISGAFDTFSGVLDVVLPLVQMLWDNFLQPVAEWTGGVIVTVLEGVADALSSIGDWISDHSKALQNISIIIGSIAASIGLVNTATTIWNGIQTAYHAIGAISTTITTGLAMAVVSLNWPLILITGAIAAVIAGIVLLINHFGSWEAVIDAFKKKLAEFGEFVSNIWDAITNWVSNALKTIATVATNVWTGIKNTVSTVITGIKTGIQTGLSTIKEIWSTMWTGMKTTVVTIFNGIWSSIKSVINSILGGIEKMANGVVSGINTVIRAMNGLSFDIPDWVPELGGKKFGFNISTLSTVSLPRLARGGIVDGATPLIAGEAGREAIVPLENNTGWIDSIAVKLGEILSTNIINAIEDNSGSDRPIEITTEVILDGKKIATAVGEYKSRRGRPLTPQMG